MMLVNSYIMYLKVHTSHGQQKKDLLTHHDFRRAIVIYWIDEEHSKRTTVKEETLVVGPKYKRNEGSTGGTSTISSLTHVITTKKVIWSN